MRTLEIRKQIAQTLMEQIGHKAFTMIGAKNFGISELGLHFKIGRNCKKVTHIAIDLTPDDLYNMTFIRCHKVKGLYKRTELKQLEGVYVDILHTAIEHNTGMYTSL